MLPTRTYHFGSYQLDPYQRLLLSEGKPIHLDPQSFEVLLVLVKNQGKVIKRSDLLNVAWDAHVDAGALGYQIYRLREALCDDPSHPTYIETLRGKGVRFKANVKTVDVNRPEILSEAERLYLKGRYLCHKSTSECARKAIGFFERAVQAEPQYVSAHVGLADAWLLLGTFSHQSMPATEAMRKAEASALKALKINCRVAEAHAALATVKALYWWDWKAAEKEFKCASRDSYDPMIRAWYALCLAGRNEFRRARDEIEESLLLDPISPMLNAISGRIHYLAREYDEAIEQCRQTIEIEEYFYLSRLFMGHILRMRGQWTEALTAFKSAAQLIGNHPTMLAEFGHLHASMGETEKARQVLDELARRRLKDDFYVSPYLLAHVYIGLNDMEKSFKWLEQTYLERGAYLIFLTSDPVYDQLRADPRFADLVKRVSFSH